MRQVPPRRLGKLFGLLNGQLFFVKLVWVSMMHAFPIFFGYHLKFQHLKASAGAGVFQLPWPLSSIHSTVFGDSRKAIGCDCDAVG